MVRWTPEQQVVVFRELIRLGGIEAATFRKHQDAIAKVIDCPPRSIYELYVKIKRETRDGAPSTSPAKRKDVNAEPDRAKTPMKRAKVATPKKGKAKAKAAEANDEDEAAIDQQDQAADAIKDEWSI